MFHRLFTAGSTSPSERLSFEPSSPWWRTAVVYPVYLRSFADSNGDGIGDLTGLRSRLPYLSWLGVDALWINPHYPSGGAGGGTTSSTTRRAAPTTATWPTPRPRAPPPPPRARGGGSTASPTPPPPAPPGSQPPPPHPA